MKLKERLNTESKQVLLEVAKVYELKGGYKLRKAELCEALAEAICQNIDKALEKLLPKDYQYFVSLTKVDRELMEIEKAACYAPLMALRLGDMVDEEYIQIPQEIKAAFKVMSSDLTKMRTLKERQAIGQKVFDYSIAAMNLYGVIPVQDFLKLYTEYEGLEMLDQETLWALEALYNQSLIYGYALIENRNIMHGALGFLPEEEIELLKKQVENKPYYRPVREVFLSYADLEYHEETEEVKKLRAFMNSKFPLRHELIDQIIEDWQVGLRMNIEPNMSMISEIVMAMEACDLVLPDFPSVQRFSELVVDLHNVTRGWINRGNTPKEIREQSRSYNTNKKIGRNDECLCGSGKKYKKCCGK